MNAGSNMTLKQLGAARRHTAKTSAARKVLLFLSVSLAMVLLGIAAFYAGRFSERYLPLLSGYADPLVLEHGTPSFSSPLSLADRLYGLSRIWQEARDSYVLWDTRQDLAWDQAYHDFIPLVLAAEDDLHYYRLLERFMALLQDGHSWVMLPQALSATLDRPAITLTPLGDDFIVTAVGRELEQHGLLGSAVVSVDDQSIDVLEEALLPYIQASTEQHLRQRLAMQLLEGPAGSEAEVTIRSPDGELQTLSLTRDGLSRGGWQNPPATAFKEELGDGIYRVTIPSFMDQRLPEMFNEAFPSFSGVRGIIFDLRGNSGGSDDLGNRIISRLIRWPVQLVQWQTRQRNAYLAAQGRGESWYHGPPWFILPQGLIGQYRGPIAILVDANTCSAAENFTVVLQSAGRAMVVGEPSCGSTGQPLHFDLPGGGRAAIVTKWDRMPDGTEWVGIGITPDVLVELTLEDHVGGRDAVLEQAVQLLRR